MRTAHFIAIAVICAVLIGINIWLGERRVTRWARVTGSDDE